MRVGFRKAITVLDPPHIRLGMTLIEVERISHR
jgi:hypothetical protein